MTLAAPPLAVAGCGDDDAGSAQQGTGGTSGHDGSAQGGSAGSAAGAGTAGSGTGGSGGSGGGGADGSAGADDGWQTGDWGPCMSECGAGTWNHYREIWCVKGGVEYKNIDDAIAQCGKAAQPEATKCDDSACSVPKKAPCSGAITQTTEESLNGATSGVVDGAGSFENGGWRSDGGRIIYDLGAPRKHGFFEATIYDTTIPFNPPAVDWIEVQLLSGYEKSPYKWYVAAPEWPSHFAWRFGDTSAVSSWKVNGHAIDRDQPELGHWQGWFDTWAAHAQSSAAVAYRFEWNVTELTVKIDGNVVGSFVFNSHQFSIQYLLVGPDDWFPQYRDGAWPVYFKNVKFGYDPSCP